MKVRVDLPKPEVSVYKGKKKNEYVMIALQPVEIATLTYSNGKWTTPQGTHHRTHKEAMRHVLYVSDHKELLSTLVPTPEVVKKTVAKDSLAKKTINTASEKPAPKEEALNFGSREEMLDFLLKDDRVVDGLLNKMKQAAPGVRRRPKASNKGAANT